MNQVLLQSQEYLNKLNTTLVQNSQKNISNLSLLLQELKTLFSETSKKFEKFGTKFHTQMQTEDAQTDGFIMSLQLLSNYLLKISSSYQTISDNISSQILEPFNMYSENFKSTSNTQAIQGKELFKDMEKQRSLLIKSMDEYHSRSKVAEKAQSTLEKLINKNSKVQDELQKAADQSLLKQQEAQEQMMVYKQNIKKMNKKWIEFSDKYKTIFEFFDSNNEARIGFTRQNLFNVAKVIQQEIETLAQKDNYYIECEKELENQNSGMQDYKLAKSFTKVSENKDINQIVNFEEPFINYELYKNKGTKVQSPTKWRMSEALLDRRNLEIFANNLLDTKLLSMQLISRNSGSSSKIEEKDLSSSTLSNEERNNYLLSDYEEKLQKAELRTHFLSHFYNNLMTKDDLFFETLSEDTFLNFVDIFKNIQKISALQKDMSAENYFHMLHISLKLYYRNQAQQKEYVLSFINQDYWMVTQRWENLFDYIYKIKFLEKKQQFDQQSDEQKSSYHQSSFFKIINKITDSSKTEQYDDSDITFMILEEINDFLLHLKLRNTEYISDLLIHLVKKKNINLELLPTLIQKQETQNDEKIRNSIFGYKSKMQRFTKKLVSMGYEDKAIYAITESLKFLSIEDKPLNLIGISKQYMNKLRHKIYKIYLLRDYENHDFYLKNPDFRIKVWKHYFKCHLIQSSYAEMKSDVAINAQLDSVENLITIDVNRSLHIHKEKISSSILQSFLRTFAYYNKEISYCQGMNYLAGFLFLQVQNEELTYKLFYRILQDKKYLKQIFVTSFSYLKIQFYQLNRIINIFLPKLAKHLEELKIHPHFYASSWFITIFAQSYQYAIDSYLVKVVWDCFIQDGWKGFFKFVIYILNYYEDKMLQLQFDTCICFIGDFMRSGIMIKSYKELKEMGFDVDNVKKQINSICITNKILQQLENEYNYFIKNLESK